MECFKTIVLSSEKGMRLQMERASTSLYVALMITFLQTLAEISSSKQQSGKLLWNQNKVFS